MGDFSPAGRFPGNDPAHQVLDLDAPTAVRRLCAPILADPDTPLVPIGRWVARSQPAGWEVQRCGSRRVIRAATSWRDPVLGRDAFAYRTGRRIVYRDLRTGRRRSGAWPTSHVPALAMFGRRVVVSDLPRPATNLSFAGPYDISLGPSGL